MYLFDMVTKTKDIKNTLANWDIEVSHHGISRIEIWGTTFDEAVAFDGDYCVIKLFNDSGLLIHEYKRNGY